jgi:long-chain acyl-CoA synthetase
MTKAPFSREVLNARIAVTMVSVGSRPDGLKGETAKAYVVLKPGATANPDSIIDLCRQELAAYKVPRAVQFVPDLPETGKVMRRELRTLDA